MSSNHDLKVQTPQAEPLSARLNALLKAPALDSPTARTARGWLDLAYEAAYGERHQAAVEAAETGLSAPGSDAPETRLMLLRLIAGIHEMRGASDIAAGFLTQRLQLLRQLGYQQQAMIEEQLGAILLREPDRVEAEVLARVAEELSEEPVSAQRADVLSSLAVHRLHEEGPDAALPLITEAVQILEEVDQQRERPQALAGARIFLAHAQFLAGEPEAALETANAVLSNPANRAVRGAMAMLRATVHHHQEDVEASIDDAMTSAELYAACGVRRGSASAAALLAGITAAADESEVSVLAWRVAVQQAEMGEFAESRTLSLALSQQLLEMNEFVEAETVLDALSLRLAAAPEDHSTRARALMGLGHAVTQQKRPLEAMSHWTEAAEQFLHAQEIDEAARAHLAAGALAASLDRVDTARTHYQKGLHLARQDENTDPLMVLQALHSLGHLLCRHEDAEGLEYLDRALEIVREHGSDWQRADLIDTRARGLIALGHGTEAVAASLQAADVFSTAGDDEASVASELFAATVLRQIGQAEESEALFRMAAADRDAEDPALLRALTGRLEALRDLGRDQEAAATEAELAHVKEQQASSGNPQLPE